MIVLLNGFVQRCLGIPSHVCTAMVGEMWLISPKNPIEATNTYFGTCFYVGVETAIEIGGSSGWMSCSS